MTDAPFSLAGSDPEASEILRVVNHFDALVAWGATADALLRAAVVLSGCAAGLVTRGTSLRLDDRGDRREAAAIVEGDSWLRRDIVGFGRVWLEREGAPHFDDQLIIDRLALALGVVLGRASIAREDRAPLEILLDPHASPEDRQAAATRLKLDPGRTVRVLATPVDLVPNPRSVVVPLLAGRVRATLDDGTRPAAGRVGVGLATSPTDLPMSWRSATLALRVSGPARPVVVADELGAVLRLLEVADTDPVPHPDAVGVARMVTQDPDILRTLDAVVLTESVRAAAAMAGVHHSTMQRRVIDLADRLGFDPGSAAGRVRLALALHLHRLATSRFD
jgi:hypothetical protein